MSRVRTLSIVALVGSLLIACAAPQPAAAQRAPTLLDVSRSIESISERARYAVVQVNVTGLASVASGAATTSDLLPEQRGTGSGVVFDPSGYIVTNAHVVQNATQVDVVVALPDVRPGGRKSILRRRTRTLAAQIVGVDRETDLAVLKVDATDLTSLDFGDSDALAQGEIVLAFGSPRGLEDSVSMGVVSSKARQISPEHPVVYIQTDASINPGNSGGPLVDARGRVVGINTFIFTKSGGSEGLGFAVPSNIVRTVANQLRANGRVRRGVIGVNAQSIDDDLATALALGEQSGVLVGDVLPGSPAQRAGLEVGDIILALDGKPMENGRQFDVNIYQRSVGDTVKLAVRRGPRELELDVGVVERVDNPANLAELVDPDTNLVPELGILGLDVDAVSAMRLRLRKKSGVLVGAVARESPVSRGRFVQGDVVHMVNGAEIKNLEQLRAALQRLPPGSPVAIQVERRGLLLFLSFRTRR